MRGNNTIPDKRPPDKDGSRHPVQGKTHSESQKNLEKTHKIIISLMPVAIFQQKKSKQKKTVNNLQISNFCSIFADVLGNTTKTII